MRKRVRRSINDAEWALVQAVVGFINGPRPSTLTEVDARFGRSDYKDMVRNLEHLGRKEMKSVYACILQRYAEDREAIRGVLAGLASHGARALTALSGTPLEASLLARLKQEFETEGGEV